MYKSIISALCILYLIAVTEGQQNGQNVCQRLKNATTTFTCKRINSCERAKEVLRSGKAVPCGFEDHVQKICCPESLINRPNPSNTTRPPPTGFPPTKDPYRIVRERCLQYTRARYVTTLVPGEYYGAPSRNVSKIDCVTAIELIVGGNRTKPKEFPHMALVGYNEQLKDVSWDCGGTLISERWVLSAAHCSNSARGPARWVRLGELVLDSTEDGVHERDFSIIENLPHPQYKAPSVYNDIALFKLHAEVKFGPYIRPICLYTSDALLPNLKNQAVITGWGYTGAGEQKSDPLLKATIFFVDENACRAFYGDGQSLPTGYDAKSMICAGDQYTGKDTCGGDSGGPLQVPMPDYQCMWSQVGITSYGSSFCGNKKPAIYTEVVHYIPWIQSIVWP